MVRTPRPAQVRFYFDADVLGVAKVIAALRPDVTYPGDPGTTVFRRARLPCIITDPGTLDPVWIPAVAAQGWVIITRDARIAQRPVELNAVRDSGARMVAMSGSEATSTWAQLEVVMTQWRKLEDLVTRPGPFIYTMTRTSLRPVDLG
jgi:hypothetical protein